MYQVSLVSPAHAGSGKRFLALIYVRADFIYKQILLVLILQSCATVFY